MVALGQGLGPAFDGEAQSDRSWELETGQGHVLHPAAVFACGLQAERLELAGDVVDHLGFGGRRGAAALEVVARQDPHVLGDLVGVDGRLGAMPGARREQRKEAGDRVAGKADFHGVLAR